MRAKKALGQNFLIDDAVISRIIEEGVPKENIPLVEIGPGPGALTRKLVLKENELWAIELDQEKVELLNREFHADTLHILHMDALKLNVRDLWGDNKGWLVGNLPYYITNPLLMHFLDQGDRLKGMTVMVQKEVADRIGAGPGSRAYGILSIAVQLAADVTPLFDVPPTAFWPQPKVTSTVLKLEMRPYPGFNTDKDVFFRIVRAAFAQRRKTIINTLSGGLGITKEQTKEILERAGIDPGLRAEDIGILDYQKITLIWLSKAK
ncbi:16S rRNA (adenine(1518)-N(6)/adenine(1519)-N(6))-dimethyltransferase RsmA [Dehalobacter sp. DCM]|uniref:16S rRNA (adenine(1518)-N(6)/adenine(1519)-N(6))- dimethyltransferase RsmA n=1 Tax=Dehalobacter sp. DCM TaxID=2907827 RepID=UPI003081FF6D|nr:16S rRNA (adenine(1518)-N(6)/adenine(1519)-N(6))-dimethyltransferase RsmA [Dehalobacter sp. DCM]